MATPTRADVRKLRRLGRYLITRPRVVIEYPYQRHEEEVSGYSDSDWAGCRRTAKSTSGGAVMRGAHLIKAWSTTQKNITLSSGEAELVAAVKMSTELIGIEQLMYEWGMDARCVVYVDSSAALGVVKRKGNGKMRHIRVGMLWIQQKSEDGELTYHKVLGTENPGDLMTKNVGRTTLDKLAAKIGLQFELGRAKGSLRI